jgi:hypothetical protein
MTYDLPDIPEDPYRDTNPLCWALYIRDLPHCAVCHGRIGFDVDTMACDRCFLVMHPRCFERMGPDLCDDCIEND